MMEQAHDPELKTAERYFLGELSDDEAEAFEAHYFECARCAEYVVEEMAMMESGREVANALRQAPPASNVVRLEPRRRWQWLPSAAAAMLALVVGVPLLIRGEEPSVDLVKPATIQVSASRAAAREVPSFPAGKPVSLDLDVEPSDYPAFVLSVRDEANDVVDEELQLTPAQVIEPISLVLGALPAGTYNV